MMQDMNGKAPALNHLTLAGRPFQPGVSRIAVLGAGVMGPGIAQVFAEHGFDVDLCETGQAAMDRGMASLRDSLQLKVELGYITDRQAAEALARVTPNVGSDNALTSAALVIEAVTENRPIKKEVYARVLQLSGPETVVWSNTSTMNIFELGKPALRSRLLVAHWFAPPQILPLVEMVADDQTSKAIMDESIAILRALGKVPVLLDKFIPGFIIPRLLRALGREAFHMIETGVCTVEAMDAAVRTSLAPRMQVLGLMQRYDYTGLNLSMGNLRDPDIVDAPIDLEPRLLKDLVDNGHLGVTTGKGFYDYEGRSTLELQRERDIRLWKVVQGVSDLVSDPKPI
ncbi:MAG: 3-hydroxybutyryl-CoA dehydrogenase [Burkholderiales bacterium]